MRTTRLMQRRRLAGWFLAGLVACALLIAVIDPISAAEPQIAAVLAVADGSVTVLRGETSVNGSYGAPLFPGDIVETGSDAEAAVLFESGQIIELGAGSRITIGSIPSNQNSGDVMAQVTDVAGGLGSFTQTDLGGDGLSVLPTVRSGGNDDRPQPVFPRETLVRPGAVTLQWIEVDEVIEYTVTLVGKDGSRTYRANDATLALPEPLESGSAWTWSVEATTIDGPIDSDPVQFEVASDEVARELEQLEERLEPLMVDGSATRADAARYLMGSYCRNARLYGEAIDYIEDLAQRHPDRKELHRDLGSLYEAIGRADLANKSYKLALKE